MTLVDKKSLIDRLVRYTRVDTAADPHTDQYPSSHGQVELGRLLAEELSSLGLDDVNHDDNGLVIATVPQSVEGDLPTVALVAHLDTSPEAPSRDVNPQVIESYPGGDIKLLSGDVIDVASCPDMEKMVGETLVTTDGTTLLGGDDKAGVAIMMQLAQLLIENPHLPHGPLRIVFTCDEEIGRGTEKINLREIDAEVAYTLDGGDEAMIDVETFSADAMTIEFVGHNIHPAIAKDRMVNSIRAASHFVDSLPKSEMTPETTDQRDGFIHVYEMSGGVGQTRIEILLRSFETESLDGYAKDVEELANASALAHEGTSVKVIRRKQYRNLADGLALLPEAVGLAETAFANLNRHCVRAIVRGGTDGSQLTEKGLPTPNLSSGQHNIHSICEFANVDQMGRAIEHLVELLNLWSQRRS